MRRIGLRAVVVVPAAIGVLFVARPVTHLGLTALADRSRAKPVPDGSIDDASRLETTRVAEVFPVPEDENLALQQLAGLLRRAALEGKRVSIAGARHSMGGHTIAPDGIVVDMRPFRRMSLDGASGVLRVQAGARFADVVAYLNDRGRSVAVMQSNSSFTVGGSLSVNCHGWQHDRPPIASTVRSFRLMRADGSIVRCSRDENAELFSLALGGYGMFGIILDAELSTVPNDAYQLRRYFPDYAGFGAAFAVHGAKSDVGMCYGRLDVAPDRFLEATILNVFVRAPSHPTPSPTLGEPSLPYLKRLVFRGQLGSAYGKRLRWRLERRVDDMFASSGVVFRNQLLAEEVGIYEGRSDDTTDILHEYFVPRERLADFVGRARHIVPAHNGDLLNVTIRMIERDDDTFLRYADQPMFSLVFLFAQPRTSAGSRQMDDLARDLIDAAHSVGGRYYLPYRLASRVQLDQCYPQARAFFEAKRRYDPGELFQSKFYERYGR